MGFYALWIPDLFMRRVKENGNWTLFCPNEAFDKETGKGLIDVWGEEFEKMYTKLEESGKGRKSVSAQQLWFRILESQMETGTPYMLYKDHANRKSNQQNLGTIHSSNLCTEILEYTSPDEVAVCNLASIALPAFVKCAEKSYDFQRLYEVTKVATKNLNKVIDGNYYPVPEARNSNMRNRPIGLGVQGLADAFLLLRIAFESDAAKTLNEDIFETIYFAACDASCELAARDGPYETYQGSPASRGQLQFDMWGKKPKSGRWDWASLKEFVQVNRHLLRDLIERKIWTEDLRTQLIANNGSVQSLDLPANIKELYKTVWEIKQRIVLDMAADRGAYIDQSQSLNIHMIDATTAKLSSMHFHGWQLGLKTGMYYLRTKAAADAIKFTVEVDKVRRSSTSSLPDGVETPAGKGTEKDAIERLKAGEPKYSCVGCSA